MSLNPPQNMTYTTRKELVYAALNDHSNANLPGRIFSWLIMVLIVLNALLVFIVFDQRLTASMHHVLYVFDVACTFVFLVEYIGRIWTADIAYSHLPPIRARFRYIFSLMGIIDFLAVIPFVGVMLGTLPYQTFNTLRVLRVIRLIKITRYISGLNMISHVIARRREEIIPAIAVLVVLIMAASVLMYQFENPVQPEKFDSIFTGMYWAITTITSTGYGDLTPITVEGRIVGMITMFCSIAIVAIPAGIFTAGFIDEARYERERKEVLLAEKKRRKAERQAQKHTAAQADNASLDELLHDKVLEHDQALEGDSHAFESLPDRLSEAPHYGAEGSSSGGVAHAHGDAHAGAHGDAPAGVHDGEARFCPHCGKRL